MARMGGRLHILRFLPSSFPAEWPACQDKDLYLGQGALNEWDEAKNGADEYAFKLWHVCIIWSRQSANPSPTVPSHWACKLTAARPFPF